MKLAALLLLLAPALLFSQQFTTPVRVNTDTTGMDREPWMHLGRSGDIFISWVKVVGSGVAGDICFTHSEDKGASFGQTVYVTKGAKVNADLQRGAPFALDVTGNVHMVWVEKRMGTQTDVWYVRSTDKGATWTHPVAISDDSMLYMQDYPSIACDSSGNIYVSFLDLRDKGRGTSTNDQLYMVKSTDNGMTWSPAKHVNQMPGNVGGTCECCKQDIQAAKNGIVAIAFRTNIADRRDIFAVRSTDFGETFTEAVPIQAQPWMLNACPASGPNCHLTPEGDFHVTWRDSRNVLGKPHIYYDILPIGATETTHKSENNIRIDVDEPLPNWPDVALYNGYTIFTFETSSNTATYSLRMPDGTMKIAAPIPGAGNKQFVGNEFANDGTRYFAWQYSGATDDILFMKDISPLPTASVKNESIGSAITPNPVRSGSSISIYGATTSLTYTIVDVLGRTIYSGSLAVLDNYSLASIPKIPAGQYFLQTGSETYSIVVTD